MDWHLKRAAAVLHQGGVIAYPTEGVWGLGCDPANQAAVLRLLDLKGRAWQKGLILIAADFADLAPYLEPLPASTTQCIQASWPGPITWLLPARSSTPLWLRGAHHTLAVRVTAHRRAAELCRRFGGALVSTSANPSGRPPARRRLQVQRLFDGALDYILPGDTGGQRGPTEIRDLQGAVVRAG